jgi:hypothetical protein
MSDDRVYGMRVPLDSEGFIRRECPTCEREFKWYITPNSEINDVVIMDGGYFCPYCGIQAPVNSWLTQAQAALARNTIQTEVVGPLLKNFGRDLNRQRSKSFSVSVQYSEPEKMSPLTELDDMRRVEFVCHPEEPIKVTEDWIGANYCLICGLERP